MLPKEFKVVINSLEDYIEVAEKLKPKRCIPSYAFNGNLREAKYTNGVLSPFVGMFENLPKLTMKQFRDGIKGNK